MVYKRVLVKESGFLEFQDVDKREFKIPLAVGFGISKKEHIKILKPYADIAVLGSVLIDIINKSQKSEMEKKIKKFLTELTFNTQKI